MIHSLFFLCSPIDTKTLRYDSLSCSPRRVWRNQVSTSAMKCHTPRPTQRLAMACHGLPWLATSTSQKLEDLWFWLQFRAKPGELLVPLRLLDKGPHPEREQCRHAVNGILNVTAGMPASLKQAHKVIHTHTLTKKKTSIRNEKT